MKIGIIPKTIRVKSESISPKWGKKKLKFDTLGVGSYVWYDVDLTSPQATIDYDGKIFSMKW